MFYKLVWAEKVLLSIIFLSIFFLLSGTDDHRASAADYSSSHFILRDPVITVGGGYGSSSSFQYFASLGQTVIGQSTSTTFIDRSGFLYFSTITNPVLSASSGDTVASLSWTVSTASLGANVNGYQVGVSTTSGGPYTYTSVGNVLSYNAAGLSNGTTYYFVVRAVDTAGGDVALSNQVSVTPSATGGGGGGGGGGSIVSGSKFSGYAYPLSTVYILQDGELVAQTISGTDGQFSVRINDLSSGTYNFAFYSVDKNGIRSDSFSFPVFVGSGSSVDVTGIFITPTIDVDKSQVKKGDDLLIFGQTTPKSDVTIQVNSNNQLFANTKADTNGVYLYNFDTAPLEFGSHSTKSKSILASGAASGYGKVVGFTVGTENIAKKPSDTACHADLNADAKVNLVDFSIAAFWYKKTLEPAIATIEKNCLNGDGVINLVDFSIMAFYWTG
jgi:hypothetical protein